MNELSKEYVDFMWWLFTNEITIKNDVDYMNALYAEYYIEKSTKKGSKLPNSIRKT